MTNKTWNKKIEDPNFLWEILRNMAKKSGYAMDFCGEKGAILDISLKKDDPKVVFFKASPYKKK